MAPRSTAARERRVLVSRRLTACAGPGRPAGQLALQVHDPQAERGQRDGRHAGPGPHPVDPVAEQQQDDEGDRPDRRPGQHDAHGVHLQRRRGLLRRTGHGDHPRGGAARYRVGHEDTSRNDRVARCRRSTPSTRPSRVRARHPAWSRAPGAVMPAKSRRPVRGASYRPPPAADSGTPADVVAGTGTRPGAATARRSGPKNGLDRFFEVSARRSTVGPRGARWVHDVLHDGLHRGAQPDHPVRRRRHREHAALRRRRGGHRADRRRHDDPHGRRRPLPVRGGDRPRHQRDRRGLRGHPAVAGRRSWA